MRHTLHAGADFKRNRLSLNEGITTKTQFESFNCSTKTPAGARWIAYYVRGGGDDATQPDVVLGAAMSVVFQCKETNGQTKIFRMMFTLLLSWNTLVWLLGVIVMRIMTEKLRVFGLSSAKIRSLGGASGNER